MKSLIPPTITTLGQLLASGYKPKSIKDELRDNLLQALRSGVNLFEGIHGFEDSVIPDLQRAILSRHNILLLGLRGQAKTRIARLLVGLLDEWIPVLEGSELNEDPLQPITKAARERIHEMGEASHVTWWHREERYTEKLATPDVTVADLIGDVDPIKAANLKLSYADERVIHFGLIPRSHRALFVINELPDLQARIQVSLFNILQEEDVQIRGFKLRLPLDIQFVFTANPEDYTNRGSIVTPLKDRIESQILTHYPKDAATGIRITQQEARLAEAQKKYITSHEILDHLVEAIAIQARSSEFVDQKSGVSARLTISAMENLYSAAERRMLLNKESETHIRIIDLYALIPSITGKIELVYEGEQEGPSIVANRLLGMAIRSGFTAQFPEPAQSKKAKGQNPYHEIIQWFSKGKALTFLADLSQQAYEALLNSVPGLKEFVSGKFPKADVMTQLLLMEFVLHGLAEYSQIGKTRIEGKLIFQDLLSNMLSNQRKEDEGEDEDWEEEEDR